MRCKRCGSFAINPDHHGRDKTNLDLCDVCFWRNKAERLDTLSKHMVEVMRERVASGAIGYHGSTVLVGELDSWDKERKEA
jgi:hypothetical protein